MIHLAKFAVVSFLALAGIFALYQICDQDEIPTPRPISLSLIGLSYRSTSDVKFDETSEEERWQSLQPTVRLLGLVCPEAESWVRHQHKVGLLFYTNEKTGFYAAYSPMLKHLILHESMFDMTDGEKASILAHEFRHSRQCLSKFVLTAMWYLLSGEMKTEVYEEEAEVYQMQVLRALLGRHD